MADEPTVQPDAEEARILAEGIVATVQQPFLILTEDLSVHSAVVSRRWWKLARRGSGTAWWSGSGGEVKVEG